MVYVVSDTKGAGRVVGVFDSESKANEILAVNPQYYRVTAIRRNEINPDCVRWVQDENGRSKLERLSTQINAVTDECTETLTSDSGKRVAIVAAGIGLAWQVVIVALAFRYGPALGKLQDELGVSLPFVSDAYWDTYRLWPIAPIVCGIPIVLTIKRGGRPSTATVVCALATAAFFTCWTIEAVMAPLREILEKIA